MSGSNPETLGPAPTGRDGATVLEHALWRDLTAATDDRSFAEAWLGLTCRMVAGTIGGVLVWLDAGPEGSPLVVFTPVGAPADAGLISAARAAIDGKRGLVQPAPSTAPDAPTRVAYPIQIDGVAIAAIALDISTAPGRDPRHAMRQLQWASAWMKERRRGGDAAALRHAADRTGLALQLIAASLEQQGFVPACRLAATEIASRLGCERVSIGFTRRHQTKVVGISHSAQFGRTMDLVRHLADAMDEAIDQRRLVLVPAADADDEPLTRAHAELLRAHGGGGQALTIPMLVKDRVVGAVTLERPPDQPFDQVTVDLAEAVVAIVGPALLDKREIDRPLPLKAIDSVGRLAVRLFGPGHWGLKLAAAGLIACGLFGEFARGPYRISADARIEGAVRRVIAAPFDGFVADAKVRAGDMVRAGAPVVSLDDRDLVLERLRWVTERAQHRAGYDQALSQGQRAETARFRALIDQANAQIRLVDEQLARTTLAAPFDGLVVSGDLSQSIGAPVRRGDVMFEIAPLDDYRVELRVHESQIADTTPGQRGAVLVSALPDVALPFVVERVTPVAEARDGRMTFRVDARLTRGEARLRPGMEGIGHIEAGDARLVWIWMRPVLHWIRIESWAWLP
ncbi:MAG: HlyD family efflux transporter periplasmic adaptor subunit [Alphaproteobacteria bacterium]|nr:HlyD family efflux transporter periplasmic adaptor subunit [Alphaproteobacteria bacterium]